MLKKILASVSIVFLSVVQLLTGFPVWAADTGNVTGVRPPELPAMVIKGFVKSVSGEGIRVENTTVSVNASTKISVPGIRIAKLSDIKVGMNVVVQAKKINNFVHALAVTVVPVIRHFVGNVTAFAFDPVKGGSISIKDKSGKVSTFVITAGEFNIEPHGAAVKPGDQVTVVTQTLRDGDQAVATGVVIAPKIERYAGNVTAFSYDRVKGGAISIVDKDGKLLTFNITAGKFEVQPKETSVKVGQYVAVTVQVPAVGPKTAVNVEVIVPVQRFTGNVTEFNYDSAKGGMISIVERGGNKLKFTIIAGKFTVLPAGAAVHVGDGVTVTARVEEGNHLVATGVSILPKTVMVKGIVTGFDEAGRTITIGTSKIIYNEKTVFTLHGVPGLRIGLKAEAFCTEQPNGSLQAATVLLNLP